LWNWIRQLYWRDCRIFTLLLVSSVHNIPQKSSDNTAVGLSLLICYRTQYVYTTRDIPMYTTYMYTIRYTPPGRRAVRSKLPTFYLQKCFGNLFFDCDGCVAGNRFIKRDIIWTWTRAPSFRQLGDNTTYV